MSWRCTEPGTGGNTASAAAAAAATATGTGGLTRRDCLTATLGLALAANAPLRTAAGSASASAITTASALSTRAADAELRAALDAKASVAERLDALARFRVDALSPSAAIDLQTVRAGLLIDQRIALLGNEQTGPVTRTGDALFGLQLERCLGEAITPTAAHRMLEAEVRRLSSRADRLLRDLGYRSGTLGARFNSAATDPRWLYSDDAAGRDRAVADMNWRLHSAKGRLPQNFADVPAFCLNVQVTHLSAAEEAAGKQGYRQMPTPDSAGAYVVDLRDIRRRPRWSLHSVVHHELLPGHLLQLPMEAASGAHALRLEYTKAFAEGWATYAEDLAADDGAFRDDATAELGLMHWLLFRALRGLADTGLHHAGWNRAKALQTLQQTQGLAAYFAPFETDLDRIIAEPATRAAEALVWIRLRELRLAAAASAAHMSPPEFHRLVLQHGRQRIDAIARSLRSPSI